MHCIVLGGLYPLVCLRSFLNLKNVLEDEKEKMRKRPLSQWTSTALNLAYFLLIPTGLVSLCTWYLLHHTNFGMSISFALTMEMVCLHLKKAKILSNLCSFLDPTFNEITLLLYGNW